MIEQVNLDLIGAWNELNRINNRMKLIEELIQVRYGISASKLKEVVIDVSFNSNDKFLNAVIFKEKEAPEYRELYKSRNAYENYVLDEIDRMKLSQPALCIAFLKEYKRLTWKQIAKEMNFSERQCQNYYYNEYLPKKKGKTPKNNSSR